MSSSTPSRRAIISPDYLGMIDNTEHFHQNGSARHKQRHCHARLIVLY